MTIELEARLDAARKQLVAAGVRLRCASSGGGTYDVCVECPGVLSLPAGVTVMCRLVTLPQERERILDPALSPVARFDGVTALAISEFLAFSLDASDGGRSSPRQQFVLKLPLEGAPDGREELVLRSLLSDRRRVVRFLLLLVSDDEERDLSGPDGEGRATSRNGQPWGSGGPALMESFLRALDRSPERLDYVARVVADLRKTEEGAQLLPPGFDAMWEPMWEPIWALRERRRPCPTT